MPLLKKRTVLAAKIETTVGTDVTPGASDAVWNAYNVSIQPNIEMVERERQGGFARLPSALSARSGQVKFSIDAIGGASDPLWASAALPGCGWVATAGTYYPISKPAGASGGPKTLTLSVYEDGLLKKITGAVGNFVMNFMSGKPVRIDFTFTGCWVAPTDASILTPTYETAIPPRFASSTLTIASYTPRLSELTIDSGNTIMLREDGTTVSGYHSACITDRKVVGKLNPETSLVATQDTWGQWLASTEQALSVIVGSSGNRITIAAPKLQFTNVQEADRDKILTDDVDFQLNGSSDLGDDELTFAFD